MVKNYCISPYCKMSQCPRSNLLLSLCLILGLTVSLGEGQTLVRIGDARQSGDLTGQTLSITSVGSGVTGLPGPWTCDTTGGNTNVVWQFPDGTNLQQRPTIIAVNDEFYYSPLDDGRVILYCGPNRLSPVGEYCCVRTGTDQRLCVTFTPGSCPVLMIPTNGNVTYTFPNSPMDTNAVATYTCDPGNVREGNEQRTCQSGGTWTGGVSTCRFVDCGPLTNPANGRVIVSTTTYQSSATYSCDTGYMPNEDVTRTCGADGDWTLDAPTCDPVVCDALTDPPNGQVMTPDGTTFMNSATYSCNSGYRLVGSMSRTCGSNGQWSSTAPTCTVNCPGLSSPGNVQIVYSSPTTPRPVGLTATYSCVPGYDLMGTAVRMCTSTGWSDDSTPTCTPVVCDALTDPPNGRVTNPAQTTFMNTATYNCNTGYILNGDMTRTCGTTRAWSGAAPTCEPVDCGSLSNLMNGQVTNPAQTTFMNTAIYSCNSGYRLLGSMSRTCGSDSQWSSTAPTCTAVDCGTLLNPMNGQVDTSSGTSFKNTATYSCDSGYTLVGSVVRMCGTDGMWTSDAPTCLSILAIVSSSSGPPMAGQSYSLTCTVTGADSLSPTISYQWTQGQTQVGTNSMMLTFDPLVLSDVGLYRCEASVRSDLLSQDFTAVSDNHQIKFESLNIQLRFNGINCREYTLSNPGLKTSDITNELVRGVEGLCGCGFNSGFISGTFLQCFEANSPDHVSYRGVVSGTSNISTVEIVSYIDQWTKTTQRLVVQSVGLNINNTCPVAIIDLRNTPECPEAIDVRSTTPPASDPTAAPVLGAIIGGVVCGVLVLVIVAAVIVIVLLIVRRQTTTGSKDIKTTEVPLSVIPQTSLTPLQVEDNHEYEDLSKFQEEENYEQVGQPHPPKGNYDLTSCPAYAPSTGGRSQTTPTT